VTFLPEVALNHSPGYSTYAVGKWHLIAAKTDQRDRWCGSHQTARLTSPTLPASYSPSEGVDPAPREALLRKSRNSSAVHQLAARLQHRPPTFPETEGSLGVPQTEGSPGVTKGSHVARRRRGALGRACRKAGLPPTRFG
jgi:arylsulfatase A-like enzyme